MDGDQLNETSMHENKDRSVLFPNVMKPYIDEQPTLTANRGIFRKKTLKIMQGVKTQASVVKNIQEDVEAKKKVK